MRSVELGGFLFASDTQIAFVRGRASVSGIVRPKWDDRTCSDFRNVLTIVRGRRIVPHLHMADTIATHCVWISSINWRQSATLVCDSHSTQHSSAYILYSMCAMLYAFHSTCVEFAQWLNLHRSVQVISSLWEQNAINLPWSLISTIILLIDMCVYEMACRVLMCWCAGTTGAGSRSELILLSQNHV